LHASEKQSGSVFGTPQYMAPEQAYGQHDALDVRTDVYALGAILHHLLTLRYPIEGDDPQAILTRVAAGDFHPARDATAGAVRLPHLPNGKVPEALSAVAAKAMANHPNDRYPTVRDFQADIASYQAGFATTAENPGAMKHTLLLFKRQRAVMIGLLAAILILAGLSVELIHQRRQSAQALQRLQAAAPALAEQAHSDLARGQAREAVGKIAIAAELAPENAAYARLQGDALSAVLQFPEAAVAYRRAVALDGSDLLARADLDLLNQILASHPGGTGLTRENFQSLADLAQRQHRPEAAIFRGLAGTGK
jgi:hypothetical protein